MDLAPLLALDWLAGPLRQITCVHVLGEALAYNPYLNIHPVKVSQLHMELSAWDSKELQQGVAF